MKNNFCLFERPFKIQKNHFFLQYFQRYNWFFGFYHFLVANSMMSSLI